MGRPDSQNVCSDGGWCRVTRVDNARHPFLDHDGPLPIVHRGGAKEAQENSFSAFQRAVDLGYRYVETDVQATSDGVLLAFHDGSLDRVTDRRGRICDQPYAQVARARIGGVEPIPLLADLLDAFPEVRFNIDSKHPATLLPLVHVLRRTNALDRVCLASFSARRLGWLRSALGPGVCTSLGPREAAALKLASLGGPEPSLPAPALCVQVPQGLGRLPLVDRRFVDTAHRKGLAVHVWTVDAADAMDRLLDLGVDGIMTDRPEVLREVLVRRGQWRGARKGDATPP
jgi:glycerophosphoryl diester phosphodiesterase